MKNPLAEVLLIEKAFRQGAVAENDVLSLHVSESMIRQLDTNLGQPFSPIITVNAILFLWILICILDSIWTYTNTIHSLALEDLSIPTSDSKRRRLIFRICTSPHSHFSAGSTCIMSILLSLQSYCKGPIKMLSDHREAIT